MRKRLPAILFLSALAAFAVFVISRPAERPAFPGWQNQTPRPESQTNSVPPAKPDPDAALVRLLLAEDLGNRTFSFATVVDATSGKRVIPLDSSEHRRIVEAIEAAAAATLADLSRADSPVRSLRRINEASRHFEDALLTRLNTTPGLRCDLPPTRTGTSQRTGYPDLRITDLATGTIAYLDPKLVEAGSEKSTLRTFYFEPKNETLKITDDAIHLLLGITHDGNDGAWSFTGWRLVDLSTLRVRLKAEFQASNADLYRETVLSLTPDGP